MTLEQIAMLAARYCGIDTGDFPLGFSTSEVYATLAAEVNNGYRTLARDGEVAVKTVEITADEDGVYDMAQLQDLIRIRRVESGGTEVPWKHKGNKLTLQKGGQYTVEYAFLPQALTDDETPQIPETKVSHTAYACYAAARYLATQGRHTDALVWENRWAMEAESISKPRGRRMMPARRWL